MVRGGLAPGHGHGRGHGTARAIHRRPDPGRVRQKTKTHHLFFFFYKLFFKNFFDDSKIHGRGSCDTKPLFACLFSLLTDLLAKGPLDLPVNLVVRFLTEILDKF